jgi:hypothetical protein
MDMNARDSSSKAPQLRSNEWEAVESMGTETKLDAR